MADLDRRIDDLHYRFEQTERQLNALSVEIGGDVTYVPGGVSVDTIEAARDDYATGRIEIDVFERRVEDILGIRRPEPPRGSWRARLAALGQEDRR